MSKYDEMSDLELNKKVAVSLGFTIEKVSIHNVGRVSVIMKNDRGLEVVERIPDYCNNPADMWPIIVENGICLTSPVLGRKTKDWSATLNTDGGSWTLPDFACGNENPLRAAAIVFLMMKDAEK